MNNSGKVLVDKLTKSKIYKDYEAAFRGATGLPFTLTPPETWGLPHKDDKNEMIYISPGYEDVWGRSCESLYENALSFVDAIRETGATPVFCDVDARTGLLDLAHVGAGAGSGDGRQIVARPGQREQDLVRPGPHPTTLAGGFISMRGSFAARANSASIEISTPGAMAPPRYSPFELTTSKFVAVPKSTTIRAERYRVQAATALTMRSAPTSRGLS